MNRCMREILQFRIAQKKVRRLGGREGGREGRRVGSREGGREGTTSD